MASAGEMIPFLSVASVDFEKDLALIRNILNQIESMTHSENGFRFSERAELAAGWWFYDVFFSADLMRKFFQLILPPDFPKDRQKAVRKIVEIFQNHVKQKGSSARIKMHGDIPFAAPWWSFLLR